MKVLYHAGCDDGFGAAYAIWLKYGNQADYIPVQYGQPFPEVSPGESSGKVGADWTGRYSAWSPCLCQIA